ncbi:MAG: hypothetical protein K0R57_1143 [Paenibacillaceae bacterium]|nr:hypothetical protein [Paenibacillaceae bacterium]
MKRRTALWLAILMLLSMCWNSIGMAEGYALQQAAQAAVNNNLPDSARVVYEESFEGKAALGELPDWTFATNGGKITLETDTVSSNVYVKLEDASASNKPIASLHFPELYNGGTVLVEFDLKTNEKPPYSHDYFGVALYGEESEIIAKVENSTSAEGYAFYIQYRNDTNTLVKIPLLPAESYHDGEWYRICLEVDTDNKKLKAHIFDISGNLLGTSDFGGFNSATAKGVDMIRFQGVSAGQGFVSVDNVKVTLLNPPEGPGGGDPAEDNIIIDPSTILSDVSHNPIGIVSNHLYDSDIYNPNRAHKLAQSLQELGVGTVRFGEGEAGDRYLWTGAPYPTAPDSPLTPQLSYFSDENLPLSAAEKAMLNPDGTYKNTQDFNEYMSVIEETGTEPFVIVGLDALVAAGKADWAKTKDQLIESAAEWVRYANVINNWNVQNWEIGNESYFPGQTGVTWSPADYVTVFKEVTAAMKAVDPTIKVGAPVHILPEWNSVILTRLSSEIDFLVVHLYSSVSTSDVDTVINDINRYCRPEDRDRIKISITENSVYSPGVYEPNNIKAAVNYATKIGKMLEYDKVNYFHFWVTRKGLNNNPLDIRSALDEDGNLLPVGKSISIWSRFLQEKMVSATGAVNTAAFASYSPSNGNLSVILTNRKEEAAPVTLNLTNYTVPEVNEKWVYKGSDPLDRNPVFEKAGSVNVENGVIQLTLDPYSVTVIALLTPAPGEPGSDGSTGEESGSPDGEPAPFIPVPTPTPTSAITPTPTPTPTAIPTPTPTPTATPVPTPTPTPTPKPGATVNFTDVEDHWAIQEIRKLIALGCIEGYPDGKFRPDNGITRAEFIKILTLALKLEQKTGKVYADTASHWARDYIAMANDYGIASGYNDTTFAPDEPLTREQMVVMIANALRLPLTEEEPGFKDMAMVSDWARGPLLAAQKNGLILDYPDMEFKPSAGATRAEAVNVIVKALGFNE